MKINSSAANTLLVCFRMILGVIFFYAGIIKIYDPQGFALAVYNYHILPGFLINPVAVILPWVEVIAGAALILGIMVQGSSLIVSGLLVIFLCAIGAALVRGLDISCGCFNTSEEADPITWIYLLRDMALLGLAVFVFLYDQGRYGIVKIVRERDRS